MSSFNLKVLAILAMLIDHVGLFFFPDIPIFRIIGRIAFPLFAFLIANGAKHTKNITKYFYRLFSFALVSQIPYFLANNKVGEPTDKLNVFFTLSMGLLTLIIIRKYQNKLVWFFATILASAVAFTLNFDYQVVGILSVVGFYLFFEKPFKLILLQVLLFALPTVFYTLYFYPKSTWQIMIENMYFAPFALLALVFIFLYNGKEGPKIKYLFYFIYPVQYIVYYLFLLSLT